MKKNLLLVATLLLVVLPTLAQKSNTIRVEGAATIYDVPELVVTTLDVEVRGDVYNECFKESLETLEKLKARFKRHGIKPESIKTNAISVRERYEWVDNSRVQNGFESKVSLEIREVSSPKFSESLLKSLNEEGLNMNYNIRFEFSKSQNAEIRKQTLEMAIGDAMQKAEIIAAAAGVQLNGIDNIGYTDDNKFPGDVVMFGSATPENTKIRGFSFADVDLNPKEKSITRKINVVFNFIEK